MGLLEGKTKIGNALAMSYVGVKKGGANTRIGNALIDEASPKNYNGLLDLATNIPVAGDVLSGLLAARDAYNGDWGSAGLNALGVLPFVSGTFIGKGAKTWDAVKAAEAAKRIDAGDDVRKVWKETGTFKGPDGHFRQEIDDSHAAFTKSAVKELRDNNGRRNGVIFPHEQLHSAYPESANVWTTKSAGADTGAYHDGVMGQSDMIGLGLPKRGIPDMEELRGTNLHEMQHAIQQREGWARGGSPEGMASEWSKAKNDQDFYSTLDALAREANRSFGGSVDKAAKSLNDIGIDVTQDHIDELMRIGAKKAEQKSTHAQDLLKQFGGGGVRGDAGHNLYKRLAGEAEARATQARMNMNMQERLNTYPLDSYDVPINQLIIR